MQEGAVHLEMRKVSSNDEELLRQIMILVVLSPVAVCVFVPLCPKQLAFPLQ